MTVNILYYDEAAPNTSALLDAMHLITATSNGMLRAAPCSADTIMTRLRADITGIGYDFLYHKEAPHTFAFYVCGENFPAQDILSLEPYYKKYNIQLHILTP